MVGRVTSLTGHGLRDWLLQRVSAVFIGLYTLFLFWMVLSHPHVSYQDYLAFFRCTGIQIANTLTAFFLLIHAWVGLWTVTTDYLNKCVCVRLIAQLAIFITLLTCFIWALAIFWSV